MLEKIILFGSRAMGTQREDSDIDLLLIFNRIPIFFKRRTFSLCYNFFKENGILLNLYPITNKRFSNNKEMKGEWIIKHCKECGKEFST